MGGKVSGGRPQGAVSLAASPRSSAAATGARRVRDRAPAHQASLGPRRHDHKKNKHALVEVMECGNRRCPPLTFCHEASNVCQACDAICDPSRPSKYESALCLEQCRDYLSEQLRGSAAVDGAARIIAAVSLAVAVVSLLLLLVLCYCLLRRPRKLLRLLRAKVDVEAASLKAKMTTNNNKSGVDISRDLNNSSVCTVSGSVSESELRLPGAHGMLAAPQQPAAVGVPVGVGLHPAPPPPARHPSEDSTLDYAAYDNPALSPSSSPLPPGPCGSAGGGKAMDAVLEAVLDHSTLPGSVPRGHNGMANGSAPRIESSF